MAKPLFAHEPLLPPLPRPRPLHFHFPPPLAAAAATAAAATTGVTAGERPGVVCARTDVARAGGHFGKGMGETSVLRRHRGNHPQRLPTAQVRHEQPILNDTPCAHVNSHFFSRSKKRCCRTLLCSVMTSFFVDNPLVFSQSCGGPEQHATFGKYS